MIVNNGEIANIPRLSPERPQQSRDIDRATVITSDSSATNAPVPVNDQIALSLATKFLQKATNAGEDVRLERILQLQTAIVTDQYQYDPLVVGRALIEAHLRGE
jgi:anti-sigma28 factor (negative regulator of flagellin synthesis)